CVSSHSVPMLLLAHLSLFYDTATTEIYTLSLHRRSSDLSSSSGLGDPMSTEVVDRRERIALRPAAEVSVEAARSSASVSTATVWPVCSCVHCPATSDHTARVRSAVPGLPMACPACSRSESPAMTTTVPVPDSSGGGQLRMR